jgi:hypothetical protein
LYLARQRLRREAVVVGSVFSVKVQDILTELSIENADPTVAEELAKSFPKAEFQQLYPLDMVTRAVAERSRLVHITRYGGSPKPDEMIGMLGKDAVERFIASGMVWVDWQADKLNEANNKYTHLFIGKQAFTPNTYQAMFSKESESINTLVSTLSEKLLKTSSEKELDDYLETNFESDVEKEEKKTFAGGGGFSLFGGSGDIDTSSGSEAKDKRKLKDALKTHVKSKDKAALEDSLKSAYTAQLAKSRSAELQWQGNQLVPKRLKLLAAKKLEEKARIELLSEAIEYRARVVTRTAFVGANVTAPYTTTDFQKELEQTTAKLAALDKLHAADVKALKDRDDKLDAAQKAIPHLTTTKFVVALYPKPGDKSLKDDANVAVTFDPAKAGNQTDRVRVPFKVPDGMVIESLTVAPSVHATRYAKFWGVYGGVWHNETDIYLEGTVNSDAEACAIQIQVRLKKK